MACGDPTNFKDNGVCPHCGHCQHCGRGGQQFTPSYPQPIWIGPTYPTYPGGWWGIYPYGPGYVPTWTSSETGAAVTGNTTAFIGGGCISYTAQ